MFLSLSSLFIFLFFLIISQTSSKMDPSKVIAAINCGGDEYTDSNGYTYCNTNRNTYRDSDSYTYRDPDRDAYSNSYSDTYGHTNRNSD